MAVIARLARHPSLLVLHAKRLAGMRTDESNFYEAEVSREANMRFVESVAGADAATVEGFFEEIENDPLVERLRHHYAKVRPDRRQLELGRFKALYAVTRITRPSLAVETGVHDGLSSCLLLAALERNGGGRLVSVDLPSTDLPPGEPQPGWLVPEELRERWELVLGDSRRLLPGLVATSEVDLFHHDSDHSREHRDFEFRTVFPRLSRRGILMSDETPPDDLGEVLAAEWHMQVVRNHPVDLHEGDHVMALVRTSSRRS